MEDKPADAAENPAKVATVTDRLLLIASYSAPTIVAIQGAAYAASTTEAPQQLIFGIPGVTPAGVALLSATLATIGAYRLRKRSKPEVPPEDKDKEQAP